LVQQGRRRLVGGEGTGFDTASGARERDLGTFLLPSGKRLHVWAIEGDCDPAQLRSNTFTMEWPPRSGRSAQFPEIDRGDWFDRAQALLKIGPGQRPVLEQLYDELG